MTQDTSTCKFGMHIKDLLDAIVMQAISVELFKLVNDTARIFRQYRFSGRNILASENIPRKTLASRNLNIPGKTEYFSTTLLQVKMEKKMEKKKKEHVSYDEVFLYLSDKKYSCSDDSRKRAIRSKAAGFITAEGVLITREKNSIEPRRWIRDLDTRMQFPSHVSISAVLLKSFYV